MAITVISLVAMSINFVGLNPMKVLVWAVIVQGLLNAASVNGVWINALGWVSRLVISWLT